MERTRIVAGNWKMNKLFDEGIALASKVYDELKKGVETRSGLIPRVILAPPFYLLKDIASLVKGLPYLEVAAQNAASEPSGAFTGEVSAPMIRSTGASFAIIGHSERRTIFAENDAILRKKADRVLEAGLSLIYCVGEILQERESNVHFEVVKNQLDKGLFHLAPQVLEHVVIAYEPVWAIGTGRNASPEQADEMHRFIRACVRDRYGEEKAQAMTILYGGSCKPSNAAEIFAMPDVDGGLIGGASLNAGDFMAIIKSI